MKNEMLREKLQGLLLGDSDYLMTIVEELNNWNSDLDYLRVYENDEEFFEMFFEGTHPMELVRMTYYGDYKFTDQYVRFNGYGNLESLDNFEYKEELKDNIEEILDELMENYNNIYLPAELEEIFDDFEEEEEEEE